MNRCLGLADHQPHASALRYGQHFGARPVKRSLDWHAKMDLTDRDPLGNNHVSNCVQAGSYRLAQMAMANAWGSIWKPTSALAVAAYSAQTGYDPETGQPDIGTELAAAQSAMAVHGLDLGGLQTVDVVLPVTLNHEDVAEVKTAADELCGVGLCFNMPVEWQDNRKTWDVAGDPGGWGLHFVPSGKFEADGSWVVISWGEEFVVPAASMAKYLVAAIAGASRIWLSNLGITPDGLTWADLKATMASFA